MTCIYGNLFCVSAVFAGALILIAVFVAVIAHWRKHSRFSGAAIGAIVPASSEGGAHEHYLEVGLFRELLLRGADAYPLSSGREPEMVDFGIQASIRCEREDGREDGIARERRTYRAVAHILDCYYRPIPGTERVVSVVVERKKELRDPLFAYRRLAEQIVALIGFRRSGGKSLLTLFAAGGYHALLDSMVDVQIPSRR